MVILAIDVTLGVATPVPFSQFVVDEVVLDVLPAVEGFLQCRLIMEILIDIIKSYHCLCLHPPMTISIHITSVEVGFMSHRTVGIETFL